MVPHATMAGAKATTGTSSQTSRYMSEPDTVEARRAALAKILPEPPPERRLDAQ